MSASPLSAKARIRIRRPPGEVFEAFADPVAMSRFWFTRRDEGLKEGTSVRFFLGPGDAAPSFEVRVLELRRPERIVLAWENGGDRTRVTWSIEALAGGETRLTIEESGFTGSPESVLERVLDSTGGFNQVVVAARALVEHGVALPLVADHAQGHTGH